MPVTGSRPFVAEIPWLGLAGRPVSGRLDELAAVVGQFDDDDKLQSWKYILGPFTNPMA